MKLKRVFVILILLLNVISVNSVFARGSSEVRLLISPPDHDGGCRLLYYVVEYRKETDKRWKRIKGKPGVEKDSEGRYKRQFQLIENLDAGYMYYFRVSVVNEIGPGKPGDHAECFIERENEIYHGIPIKSGDGYPKAISRSSFDIFDTLYLNKSPIVQIPYRLEE